jgi:hypothetical protein
MGANLVVVPPPILDEYLGFQQSCEDLSVGYIVTIHRNSDLASQAIAAKNEFKVGFESGMKVM